MTASSTTKCPSRDSPASARPRNAADYGYVKGDILGGSGHLRVIVSPQKAKVEFVRALLPKDENETSTNRHVDHSYQVTAYEKP